MSSNKRHSILPPIDKSGPKPPASLSSSLTISDNAILMGTHSVTIQSESVVHPRARLESLAGSIFIGRRCIIAERSHLGAAPSAPSLGSASRPASLHAISSPVKTTASGGGVVLGDYVTVEVGAVIEAGGTEVGEGTLVGVRSRIGHGARVGKNCTITPLSTVAPGEEIPDRTVVYSDGMRRLDMRDVVELNRKAQVRQIEQLRRVIPSNAGKFQQ